jgi:2-phosphosulfolactate phosphatase
VFTGAIVNAEYLAERLGDIIQEKALNVTVIACGERIKTDIADNIRWAIEDYLGAGAIISYLRCAKTLEAEMCESVFIRNRDRLNVILLECESGLELSNIGFRKDVLYSAQLNMCKSAPVLENGCYVNINQKIV